MQCLLSDNHASLSLLLYFLSPNSNSYSFVLSYPASLPSLLPSTEHLGLALALSVPVFVVVTKIDMCPPNVLQETLKLLNRVLKSPGSRKIPVMVQTDDDVITAAVNFTSERQEEGIFICQGALVSK